VPNQSIFIKGRKLVDCLVARKSRKEELIFKMDFEESHDLINKSFVNYMMRMFVFL